MPPGTGTRVGPYAPEAMAAISPDGREMTLARWEQVFSLMLAERVPGVDGPRRAPAR